MSAAIDTDLVRQYEEDGYIVMEDLFAPDEIDALRQRVEDACNGRIEFPEKGLEYEPGRPHERDIRNVRKLHNGVLHDDVFRRFAADPRLLDVAEALIGSDIKLFGDQLFIKPPGGIEKTYHQDSPYFKIEPMALVSGWIAVDDVNDENGCVRVIRGSHKLGPQPHSDAWMVGDRKDMKIPDRLIDRSRERLIEMKAGSVSFHHSLLMHASGPNRSPRFRRGHAFHYMSAQSRRAGREIRPPSRPISCCAAASTPAASDRTPSTGVRLRTGGTVLHLRRVLLACTLALAPSAAPLRSATLYVSTHGRSGWSGRLPAPGADGSDGPLPSLDSARDAVRELRRRGETGPVEVLLRGGVYPLDAPFVLGPDDSGSPGAPVVYAAYPGERPVLSGSRLVRGWRREAGALWTARLPSSTLPRQSPRQLFVGGRRAQRARAPNHGFLRIPGPSSKDARFRLPFAPGSIPSAWAGREVEAIVLLGWTSLRRPIVEVDEARGVAALAGDSGGSSVARVEGIDARFYLENAREALDAEGEWFYDRQAGIVSCWPRGGEDLARDPVTVSAIPVLVRLEGRPEAGRSVHDVTLRGLAFRETNWEMGATGFADHPQAAVEIPAAVEADGAERCTVEECTFSSLGGYAVAFGRAARANRVTGNTMRDLGAGGVKLGATELPAPSEESFENLVADNHIHDIGVVYPGAVGILVLQSSRNAIVHNLIHDTNYTGISVGWTWGYAENRCRGNRIESNVLHHIARGMLDDLGAIYTLGVQPGTVIRNNVIHDVEPFSMRGRGIYLDEGSTDILVENNVVSRVRSAGFHQHYGRDNVVRNNIFAFNGDAQVSRARAEAHRSYTFERNLVVFSSGRLLGGSWNDAGFHFARNLYHDLRGAPLGFGRFGWDEWRARGQDEGSVVADPRLADAAGGDFALPPDSPARAVGFRPIDATLAGIRPTPHGTRVIRDLEYARPGGKPLLLDLYLPEKAAQKLPVVVSIHGGGWHGGQKERSPGFALAASGYAVASIDYRLTGEATFPAQIEDCKAAVRWLRAEAGRYGLDPERFGAWGTSAGGHLAALLGTSGGVAELEGNLGNAGQSSRVQAVVDFFGPVDTAAWYRHKGETQAGLIGAPVAGSEARLARANPATYVDRADPPFLVAHGRRDTLVPAAQSEAFAEALRRAGVPVTLELVAGAGHSAPELRLDEVVRAFFDRHLRDRP